MQMITSMKSMFGRENRMFGTCKSIAIGILALFSCVTASHVSPLKLGERVQIMSEKIETELLAKHLTSKKSPRYQRLKKFGTEGVVVGFLDGGHMVQIKNKLNQKGEPFKITNSFLKPMYSRDTCYIRAARIVARLKNLRESPFQAKDEVTSQWYKQGSKVRRGTIIKVRNDGTVDIRFDDGDEQSNMNVKDYNVTLLIVTALGDLLDASRNKVDDETNPPAEHLKALSELLDFDVPGVGKVLDIKVANFLVQMTREDTGDNPRPADAEGFDRMEKYPVLRNLALEFARLEKLESMGTRWFSILDGPLQEFRNMLKQYIKAKKVDPTSKTVLSLQPQILNYKVHNVGGAIGTLQKLDYFLELMKLKGHGGRPFFMHLYEESLLCETNDVEDVNPMMGQLVES